ncbi:MAG: DUF1998 domain-containing protein [Opitutae bacterium]|nr:DUF1998 domain-containing protein [Opitutae bacterium]
MQTLANCQFWSGEAEVCIVNNNAGRQFHFLKLANSETWVTQEAMDHIADQIAQRNLRPVAAPVYDQNEPPDIRSLGSVKQTDMLILNLHSVRPGIDLSPLRVEGRAALNSFGFMLRRAMSAILDISPWEIRVGLRVAHQDGRIVGQVFLSDSLENGAGYCSHFNQPAELEKLLRFVASPDDAFLRDWLAPHHSADCQTS